LATLTKQILAAPNGDKLGSIGQDLCQSLRVNPELSGSFHYLKPRWIRCRFHVYKRRNGICVSVNARIDIVVVPTVRAMRASYFFLPAICYGYLERA
jgi:hypothetical protein